MSAIGEVISTTRRARGLTQQQLAHLSGVTQAALSRYENDLRDPDAHHLTLIASALGVTPAYVERAGRARGGVAIDAHMRRRATAAPGVWRKLEARLNVYRWHLSQLSEEVELNATTYVPPIDPAEADPSTAARLVRAQWKMPVGPVRQLTNWLEAAGCVVILEDFGTARVDGLSQWIEDHPVILLNAITPPDRARLTLAHELGHLVLHNSPVAPEQDVEQEANEFAGEILMPTETIRPSLRNLRAERLIGLKREYGVSMQAIVERAYRAGYLSTVERTRLYKVLSARGWRTKEPGSDEIPAELPQLPAAIGRSLCSSGLSPDEIATIAGFASSRDNTIFAAPGLRAV